MSVCASCGHRTADSFQFCPNCGTRAVAPPRGLVGQTLLGKYRVLEPIGTGSMGMVYLAEHVGLQKRVAIKVLHRELQVDHTALQRFQREGIAAGHLQHPNSIQIFDFDRGEDGSYFLAMEHVEGPSLRQLLQERGALPVDEAIDLASQLLSVLAAAHRQGVVHRDLKPENLMVTAGPQGALLKVLDFGLSKLVHRPLGASLMTHTGAMMGTPLYMAPEQWRGEEADHRADLYAVGLLLFEMVAGRLPFAAHDLAEAFTHATTHPAPSLLESAPTRSLPAGLDEVVQRALARSRAERWQHAQEMADALDAIDLGQTQSTRSPRTRRRRPPPGTRPPHRHIALPSAIGAVVLLAAGAAWFVHSATRAVEPLVRDRAAAARSADEQAYVALLEATASELRLHHADAALSLAQQATAKPCCDAEGLMLRGRAYRARGDVDLARADLQAAEQRLPGWPPALVERGWLELDADHVEAAEAAFAAARKAPGENLDALAGLAALSRRRADPGRAVGMLAAVANAHPGDAQVQLQYGLALLDQGATDEAVAALVAARRGDATLWQAAAGLGSAYAKQGNFAAAVKQFRDALAASGGRREVALGLVDALLGADDPAQAETALPTVAAEERTPLWQVARGLAAFARGDTAGCARELTAAAKAPNAPAPLLAAAAAVALLQGDADAAAALGTRAAQQDPELGVAHLVWGLSLFDSGDVQGAGTRLMCASSLRADDAWLHRAVGLLCRDWLLQPAQALTHFQRAEQLGSEPRQLRAWIAALNEQGVQAAPLPPAPTPATVGPRDGTTAALQRALATLVDRLRESHDFDQDHSTWGRAWEASSAHFTVRTTQSYGLALDLANGLELTLTHLQHTLGLDRPPARRLSIWVLPSLADYNQFGAQNGQEHSSFYGSFFASQHAERPVVAVYDPNPTLLRMTLTHSMVHQYLAEVFTQPLPTWIDEGLAAYIASDWDYAWTRDAFATLTAQGKTPHLRALMRDGVAGYTNDAAERMLTLGMMFHWMFRFRADTMTQGPEQAPFRDYLLAQLGHDTRGTPVSDPLADPDAVEREFLAFAFPR